MTKSDALAVIHLDHLYAHPAAAVWTALTDPAWLARWWAPSDMRPIVGHTFPEWPGVLARLQGVLDAPEARA